MRDSSDHNPHSIFLSEHCHWYQRSHPQKNQPSEVDRHYLMNASVSTVRRRVSHENTRATLDRRIGYDISFG